MTCSGNTHALEAAQEYGWLYCLTCRLRLTVNSIHACKDSKALMKMIGQAEKAILAKNYMKQKREEERIKANDPGFTLDKDIEFYKHITKP